MTRERAYQLRKIIELAATSLDDTTALEAPELFAYWETNTQYNVNDRRRDRIDTQLYRCVQAHISQSDWAPSVTPALWARVVEPNNEWPDWVQPTGAQDAYANGDKVAHNDKHWVSAYDNNVWEPGVFGWTEAQYDYIKVSERRYASN